MADSQQESAPSEPLNANEREAFTLVISTLRNLQRTVQEEFDPHKEMLLRAQGALDIEDILVNRGFL